MRVAQILLLTIALFPQHALADHFDCDLQLSLIPNTESSETKKLFFNVDLTQNPPLTTGSLITTSCFGTFSESLQSDHSQFKTFIQGDRVQGTFNDHNLAIGLHHYRLALSFVQYVKSPPDETQIDFIVTGKLMPLDNELFFNQIVNGECHLNLLKITSDTLPR